MNRLIKRYTLLNNIKAKDVGFRKYTRIQTIKTKINNKILELTNIKLKG